MTNLNRRAFLRSSLAVALHSSVLAAGGVAFAAQAPDTRLRAFLRSGENSVAGIRLRHKEKLVRVYTEREFSPLWSANGKYTDTCRAFVGRLGNSPLLGLHPSRYYTKILATWLQTQDARTSKNLEVLLTDVLFEYFDDLANGQTGKRPGDADSWFAKQSVTNVENNAYSFLRGDATFNDTINHIQPVNQQYTDLLVALGDHYTIYAKGGYTEVSEGSSLKPGQQDYRIRQLRRRLSQSGDHTDNFAIASTQFDSWLAEGLKTFQDRHGLEADGVLGSKTLKALNTPVEERIAQIEVNLDRWRWLPKDLGQNHIIVNTAGFQMDVVLDGLNALHMNVVVGKPKHKTPVFSEQMEHLVFNPSWNVPKSIASKELLPRELKNPGYLKNKNFVAVSHADQSTRSIESFSAHELQPSSFTSRYRLKQLPGSDNALGTVKFMLPNKYAIYLHDTNAKSLFQNTTRAYSHGCVRVEDPVALAKTLLANEGYSEHDVEAQFASKRSKTILLRKSLPVHITYQTAWVDQYGKLNFRNDIYNHDAQAIQHKQEQQPALARREHQLLTQLGSFASNEI